MIILLYYILIGFIFAIIDNYLICNLQTKEEATNENPGMIIFLLLVILFWPFIIILTIKLMIIYFKTKKT